MIYLASDHAGFELKNRIKKMLEKMKLECKDIGPHKLDSTDDYPDFILPAAKKVSETSGSRGIVLGGSGQGEAIAANKVKGIRAAVYYGGPLDIVKLSRLHNDSNILSLGARFLQPAEAEEAVRLWLSTEYEGGRHDRRIRKISRLEDKDA